MDRAWNALPPVRRSGVFGATALKWYSKMAEPRAILEGSRSRSGMGMVLGDAGASRPPAEGIVGQTARWNHARRMGGNDMMHLQAMHGPAASRPHFVAS